MDERATFSGTRLGVAYFLLQAIAIAAWWGALIVSPVARAAFRPPGTEEADLLAFALPDAAAVVLSFSAALALARGSAWGMPLAWAATGVVLSETAYLLGWASPLERHHDGGSRRRHAPSA